MTVEFEIIGEIHTAFEQKSGIPIQSAFGQDLEGTVTIYPQYQDGLKDLDGFSHVYLIYHFNRHHDYTLQSRPYLDEVKRGVFATRAPKRPNGIGISVVKVTRIENNIIYFRGVDTLNNTPLLDIKPYIPDFDHHEVTETGWYGDVKSKNTISDNRF